MEERDSPIPIVIGVMTAFSWHLFGGDSVYSVVLYVLLLSAGVIVSTKLNGRKPFKGAGYITFGVIIGTIIDLILFPTIDGFERNLAPIEIVLAAAVSTIVTCVTAAFVRLYWRLTNAT